MHQDSMNISRTILISWADVSGTEHSLHTKHYTQTIDHIDNCLTSAVHQSSAIRSHRNVIGICSIKKNFVSVKLFIAILRSAANEFRIVSSNFIHSLISALKSRQRFFRLERLDWIGPRRTKNIVANRFCQLVTFKS